MKSVGEVMAIGRTLRESFFKALRSLEVKNPTRPTETDRRELAKKLSVPSDERIRYVVYALEQGWSVEEVSQQTSIDPWFLDQFQQFAELQGSIRATTLETIDAELLRKAKRDGFSDRRISFLLGTTAEKLGPSESALASNQSIRWSIPARLSLNPTRLIFIQRMKKRMKPAQPTHVR